LTGPAWWPILGSALTIERKRRKENSLSIAAYNLAKEYGDGKLVGLKVGVDRQVIVTCPEVAKELAACSEFDGRPKGPFFRFRTWGLRRGMSRKFKNKTINVCNSGRLTCRETIEIWLREHKTVIT
jgi:hypothetical protein